jgi:hypothetical protein
MSAGIGHRRWVIADGYIPPASTGPAPDLTSHEAVCVLNTGDSEVSVTLTLYFTDRGPAGPYRLRVGPQRTNHIRMNLLHDPEPVPLGTPYSCVVEASGPVVVQHTRLDSRQPANALLSTIAYPDRS